MATKKIKIDFSKTEERSGWNTRHIPAGLHKAQIVSVQETEAQDGTAMLVYGFQPTDIKYRTRKFPFYCKLQQNQLWKLRDLLVAAGETVPKKSVQIDPNKVVGREIAIEVEDDMYNGNVRSTVQAIYNVAMVDEIEEDLAAEADDLTQPADEEDFDEDFDQDDEMEEDFDDDEDDFEDLEDDEDDEDDFEDDEEEDDFDDEDFDEDDFEEEDFDDEDFDDEEELEEEPEPEPAPKKRARKAASPAPKKRVVRRRAAK